MTNQKSTKRALLTSVLALLVCVTMLIGSTFAWFTDTVSSGRNTIQSGNLDAVVEYYDAENNIWNAVESTTVLFDEDKWEPGHTKAVTLKVSNIGTLAFKYNLAANIYNEKSSVNVYGDEFKLSDYLEVKAIAMDGNAITDSLAKDYIGSRDAAKSLRASAFGADIANNAILSAGSYGYVVIAITMPEETGNEANYKTGYAAPSIKFGIDLVATQYTEEEDTFGSDYDKDATYPELPAADVTKLDAAQIATIGALDILNDAGSDTYTLDTGYSFKTEDTAKNIESNPYKYWNVDYVISFDKAVPANSVALAGAYESFANGAWLAFTNPMAIAANEELRLLESAVDFTSFATSPIFVNYGEIVSNVGEFKCGATDINNALAGTTITVELRAYETAPADKNADNSHNNETGAYKVIDTVTYTF